MVTAIKEKTRSRKAFTVEEFYRMGEVGILKADDRVELIEGDIIEMAAIGTRHAGCVNWLTKFFSKNLDERALVTVQNPILLSEYSQPQPDLTIARIDPNCYRTKHPQPQDIFLIIEVSETTIKDDREKALIYGLAGISEYWIVNLDTQLIEVYRHPNVDGYRDRLLLMRLGESISPLAFPDLIISVADILPPC